MPSLLWLGPPGGVQGAGTVEGEQAGAGDAWQPQEGYQQPAPQEPQPPAVYAPTALLRAEQPNITPRSTVQRNTARRSFFALLAMAPVHGRGPYPPPLLRSGKGVGFRSALHHAHSSHSSLPRLPTVPLLPCPAPPLDPPLSTPSLCPGTALRRPCRRTRTTSTRHGSPARRQSTPGAAPMSPAHQHTPPSLSLPSSIPIFPPPPTPAPVLTWVLLCSAPRCSSPGVVGCGGL